MASNLSIAEPRFLSRTSGGVAGSLSRKQRTHRPCLAVLTLRNLAFNPLVVPFIEYLREVVRSMPAQQGNSRSGNSPLRDC